MKTMNSIILTIAAMATLTNVSDAGEQFRIRTTSSDVYRGRAFVTVVATNITSETLSDCTFTLSKTSGVGYVVAPSKVYCGWIEPGETMRYVFELKGVQQIHYNACVHSQTREFDFSGPEVPNWLSEERKYLVTLIKRHNQTGYDNTNASEVNDCNREADALNIRKTHINRLLRQIQVVIAGYSK